MLCVSLVLLKVGLPAFSSSPFCFFQTGIVTLVGDAYSAMSYAITYRLNVGSSDKLIGDIGFTQNMERQFRVSKALFNPVKSTLYRPMGDRCPIIPGKNKIGVILPMFARLKPAGILLAAFILEDIDNKRWRYGCALLMALCGVLPLAFCPAPFTLKLAGNLYFPCMEVDALPL